VQTTSRRFGARRYIWIIAASVCLAVVAFLAVFWLHRPEDVWTSRPLTLALFPLERKNTPAVGAGSDELIESHITQALRASGRLKVVERAILEKVLAELKLGTSDLVDPQAALRVGRMLAARLIATGSLRYVGAGVQISVRVIETETTNTAATEAETVDRTDDLDGIVQHISHNLLAQIRQAYPLQGRITHITPQGLLLLNIGAQHGVTAGLTLQVFGSADPLQIENPIGQVVVTDVGANYDQAKVLQATLALQLGWRVLEVQEP
jgi:TolB-like protein